MYPRTRIYSTVLPVLIDEMDGIFREVFKLWRTGATTYTGFQIGDNFSQCRYMDGQSWTLSTGKPVEGVLNESENLATTVTGGCWSWDYCTFEARFAGGATTITLEGVLRGEGDVGAWNGTGACANRDGVIADPYYLWNMTTVEVHFTPNLTPGGDGQVADVDPQMVANGDYRKGPGATKPPGLQCPDSGNISSTYS